MNSSKILLTFYDGSIGIYHKAILSDLLSIAYDPSVVEITDIDNGKVLYQI